MRANLVFNYNDNSNICLYILSLIINKLNPKQIRK